MKYKATGFTMKRWNCFRVPLTPCRADQNKNIRCRSVSLDRHRYCFLWKICIAMLNVLEQEWQKEGEQAHLSVQMHRSRCPDVRKLRYVRVKMSDRCLFTSSCPCEFDLVINFECLVILIQLWFWWHSRLPHWELGKENLTSWGTFVPCLGI